MRLDALDDGQYGYADCDDQHPALVLNVDYATAGGGPYFYKVVRHELLHLLGASHTGKDDSAATADNPVTMATCVSYGNFTGATAIDRDSEIYLNWAYSALSNRQLKSNIGYENGLADWGASNGTVSNAATGGIYDSAYASYYPTGTSADSFLRQSMRLWTGNDSSVEFRAVINARSPSSATTTRVRAALWTRLLSESGNNGCAYPRGLQNPNNETVTANYVLVSQSAAETVSTGSWTSVNSPWTSVSVRDGWHLQLRAYGNSSGDYAVWFDHVRAEER